MDADPTVDPNFPLSSMVALTYRGTAPDLPTHVLGLVQQVADDTLPAGIQFPLAAASTDGVRALQSIGVNVVTSWLDPLRFDDAMDAPRFGANADYIAYFGDGWDDVPGNPPQWNGADYAGWVWVNHEYVSNAIPTSTSAPTGQALHLARFLRVMGGLTNNVFSDAWTDTAIAAYVHHAKRQVGGSWFRIIQDPASGEWMMDRNSGAMRYDATSDTRVLITGFTPNALDHDDAGNVLPAGVASGIAGDCSGAQTPWGTIISAEENVQDYYGDLEDTWTSNQKFLTGGGFDPGANVAPYVAPSATGEYGMSPDVSSRHNRDLYGFLAEIDPGVAPDEYAGATTAGVGHKKLGAVGRARWENATFVTDSDWKLIDGQPVVLYAGNDRRSGRIYKFVSSQSYSSGMTRAQIRALLDDGTLYVGHFAGLDNTTGDTLVGGGAPTEAAPGTGRWVELSVDSTDLAPNGAGLGNATQTVGAALRDVSWNGIGGFPDDNTVKAALFTAATKVGVMELNRPEDLEWNPRDPSGIPRLYVAFTNNGRKVANDQAGVLYAPATHDTMSPTRPDRTGSIFAMEEANPANPSTSMTFEYFQLWHGTQGTGVYDAANPDNLMVDAYGHLWFGTDGNFGTNGRADALYYLDLDPAHRTTTVPTYGRAFRVAAAPSDAEATGPAFSSRMGTLFFNVQHPGEGTYSAWPYGE